MTYLTERQRDVLRFIEQRIEAEGVAPTLQEIATAFSFRSTASAQKHVAQLERKGFLRREKHQKRGLILPDSTPSALAAAEVPLLGVVAAGVVAPGVLVGVTSSSSPQPTTAAAASPAGL